MIVALLIIIICIMLLRWFPDFVISLFTLILGLLALGAVLTLCSLAISTYGLPPMPPPAVIVVVAVVWVIRHAISENKAFLANGKKRVTS